MLLTLVQIIAHCVRLFSLYIYFYFFALYQIAIARQRTALHTIYMYYTYTWLVGRKCNLVVCGCRWLNTTAANNRNAALCTTKTKGV